MPDIYHFFRVEEIVRYQGKGTEILVIEGITARNDIEDINDNLKTVVSNFLENALYVYGLGKSKPIIQILVPTATSLPDLEDKGEYDYKAFIVDFDLHEIQIEIPEECGIEKELKNKMFPSNKTLEKIEKKNEMINEIQNKIENGEIVSLPLLTDEQNKSVKEWDKNCNLFKLNDKNDILEVAPISLNDIIERPNIINQYNSFLTLLSEKEKEIYKNE